MTGNSGFGLRSGCSGRTRKKGWQVSESKRLPFTSQNFMNQRRRLAVLLALLTASAWCAGTIRQRAHGVVSEDVLKQLREMETRLDGPGGGGRRP
jgi:hypothetical protein